MTKDEAISLHKQLWEYAGRQVKKLHPDDMHYMGWLFIMECSIRHVCIMNNRKEDSVKRSDFLCTYLYYGKKINCQRCSLHFGCENYHKGLKEALENKDTDRVLRIIETIKGGYIL